MKRLIVLVNVGQGIVIAREVQNSLQTKHGKEVRFFPNCKKGQYKMEAPLPLVDMVQVDAGVIIGKLVPGAEIHMMELAD